MAVGGNKLEQNGEILGSNGFLYPKLKVDVIGEIGTGPVLGIRHGTGRPPACDRAHETTAMRFAGKSSDRATETRAGKIVLGKSIDQREQTQTTWFGQGLLTRPSSATAVLGRQRLTWRPLVGRAAGSGDPRRTSHPRWSRVSLTVFSDLSPCSP